MAATIAPVEVGTMGTIGSLLKKEIDYFRRLEIDCYGSSTESQRHVQEMDSGRRGGSHYWSKLRLISFTWRKNRRKRGNGVIRPGICSMVEVADSSHMVNEIRGYSYINLRADSERFDHVKCK